MVALIFERVEGLVFDLPAATPTAYKQSRVLLVDLQVRYPTEALDQVALHVVFAVFKVVYGQVLVALVQRYTVEEANLAPVVSLSPRDEGHPIPVLSRFHVLVEKCVIARLHPQNIE